MEHPVVEVKEGKIKGFSKTSPNGVDFYCFRGIPYAKPPVGELRFAPPAPPDSWQGVRDANNDLKICKQFDKITSKLVGDEDCLYLNVFTPKLPDGAKPLPVMVFFHGGGFIYGNGIKSDEEGPDYFVEKGVVYVGLNYRLGILGFLSLNRKEAPGNMGLKDQVQALKWVQQNISKFNGDPNNVTIFGISAGGASVEYLYISPMAKGLFHKAIAQSGSSLLHWAFNKNVKALAAKIPERLKQTIANDDELYEYLKHMPIDDLINASIEVIYSDETAKGGIHFGFVPTLEVAGDWEPFISSLPLDTLKKGEFDNLPFISGYCTSEGLLMDGLDGSYYEKFLQANNLVKYLPFNIRKGNEEEVKRLLFHAYQNQTGKADLKLATNFISDVDFIGGIAVAAKYIAKKRPVYFYEFAYDGALNFLKCMFQVKRAGACHGDDIGYLFKLALLPENVSENDKLVRKQMVEMWTDFAKTGNPTPDCSNTVKTKWEPMSDKLIKYLKIDVPLLMLEDPIPERIQLFNDLYHNKF